MHLLNVLFLLHTGNLIRCMGIMLHKGRFPFPSAQLFIQLPKHFLLLKIACHRKHDIFLMIIPFIIRPNEIRIKGSNRFLRPQNRHPQRSIAPDGILQSIMYQLLRRIVVHINFLCNHIALLLHLLLCNQGMQQHITHHIQCAVNMLIQHTGMIAGIFLRGICVNLPAERIHFLRNLPCRAAFRPLEHHVLNIMRHTVFLRQFISGAVFHPYPEGNAADIGNGFQCDLYAVVQCSDCNHTISPKSAFCFYHEKKFCFYAVFSILFPIKFLSAPDKKGRRFTGLHLQTAPACVLLLFYFKSYLFSSASMASFMEKFSLPCLSISISFTETLSPTARTSSTFATRLLEILEI